MILLLKIKRKKKKEEVDSKSKFEIGKFWYIYENNFDGCTTTYHLWINIKKITKCYIWVDVNSQFGQEFSGKIWKNKCDISEYINYNWSLSSIWSDELRPY